MFRKQTEKSCLIQNKSLLMQNKFEGAGKVLQKKKKLPEKEKIATLRRLSLVFIGTLCLTLPATCMVRTGCGEIV